MKTTSLFLTTIMIATNYFAFKIHLDSKQLGDSASIGIVIYQLAYWFGGLLLAAFVIAWDGIKSMSMYDKIVFILTTPISFLMFRLFMN